MVIDAIVIAVLLISALIAFLRGFIRETLTILGVGGGLAAAYVGGPMLSPVFKDMMGVKEGEQAQRLLDLVPYPIVADILSYGVIFIVVVIVLSVLSHILAESARAIGLGAVDRTLGVVFGLARGVLLLGVMYLPVYIGVDAETKKEWFEGSKTNIYLESVAGALAEMLPDSAIEDIKSTTEAGVKEKLEEIDLLKKEGAEETVPAPLEGQEAAPPAPEKSGPGYSEEFRERMNKMFEQAPGPQETPHE